MVTIGYLRYAEVRRDYAFAYKTIKAIHVYVTSRGGHLVLLDLPQDDWGQQLHKRAGKIYTDLFLIYLKY